ncbi:MAG: hypothetical protein ACE10A_12715 [Acidiferrobacterales bacterium]
MSETTLGLVSEKYSRATDLKLRARAVLAMDALDGFIFWVFFYPPTPLETPHDKGLPLPTTRAPTPHCGHHDPQVITAKSLRASLRDSSSPSLADPGYLKQAF